MEASLVVDLDLAVQVVPLVQAGALLVSPALTTVAVELDLFVEKSGLWARHRRQRIARPSRTTQSSAEAPCGAGAVYFQFGA